MRRERSRPWRTLRCCGGSSGQAWPGPSSGLVGGSGWTPSSAAASRSPSSTTSQVRAGALRFGLGEAAPLLSAILGIQVDGCDSLGAGTLQGSSRRWRRSCSTA